LPLSTLVAPPPPDAIRDFARDVARDLALTPKQIQSKYLYDALGSSLFESICRLPWYRITRAESRLLARSASEMVDPLEDPVTLLELGCGSGEKIATLAEALRGRRRRVAIHLIDISPTALELSERALGALEHVSVVGHRATYEEGPHPIVIFLYYFYVKQNINLIIPVINLSRMELHLKPKEFHVKFQMLLQIQR
jgi:uncharacterized SAM-dependent methyltransferase